MINNKAFLNLERYVDLTKIDKLHYKICYGFSKARHLAKIANIDVDVKNLLEDKSYTHLCQSYQNYKLYSEDSEIKKISKDLNESELATFLKFSLGGYDLYNTYNIKNLREYFPEVYDWVMNLQDHGIFSRIDDAFFLTLDSGGIPFEHYHIDLGSICEFIHIRPKLDRPFYVRDNYTLEKIYIDARVAWWDDRHWHGGDPVMKPTYSLRIDGRFTKEFKNKILKNESNG